MKQFNIHDLPRVTASANDCSATIRVKPEHFQVDEVLPFEPDGEGGHVWLNIQKRGINTDWLATELARFAKVPPVAVGYAGLKDRHAVTTQWFSIKMEGVEPVNWSDFETDDIRIISQTKHSKKLKRGVLSGNYFRLTLTDLIGDKSSWLSHLETVQQQGVPNYFGEQRFGHNANNLERVDAWFSGGKAPKKRNQKSMYLSAARSWLFNLIVAERIKLANWNQAVDGDVMALSGSNSSFLCEQVDQGIQQRVEQMDIHPTATQWGRGKPANIGISAEIEDKVFADWQEWQQGLEKAGLSQDRRAMRVYPKGFNWQFIDDQTLELAFFLDSGCYATAVMRELANIVDAQHRNYQANKAIEIAQGLKPE